MAPSSRTPVLSLSTVIPRPLIDIDGQPYELRTANELPWLMYRGHANTFQKAGELLRLSRRTPAQDRELDRLLPPLVEALVDAPKAVLAKLNNDQRFAVLTVFSQLLLAAKAKAKAGARRGRTATSAPASSTKTGVH